MTWVKLDDAFFRHPKAIAAGAGGRALFLASLCHCSNGLTDGFVSRDALPVLLAESGAKRADVARVVAARLWSEVPGGFEVHDYLDRNPDADTVRAQREARSRAGRIGGQRSRPPTKPEASASTFASPGVPTNPKQNGTPSPVPTTGSSSTSSWEPPGHAAVDDDERSAAPQPIDFLGGVVGEILERCADVRMQGKTVANRAAYRRRVLDELRAEHDSDLRRLIPLHPRAPIQSFAGHVLGEPNSLHIYRVATAPALLERAQEAS